MQTQYVAPLQATFDFNLQLQTDLANCRRSLQEKDAVITTLTAEVKQLKDELEAIRRDRYLFGNDPLTMMKRRLDKLRDSNEYNNGRLTDAPMINAAMEVFMRAKTTLTPKEQIRAERTISKYLKPKMEEFDTYLEGCKNMSYSEYMINVIKQWIVEDHTSEIMNDCCTILVNRAAKVVVAAISDDMLYMDVKRIQKGTDSKFSMTELNTNSTIGVDIAPISKDYTKVDSIYGCNYLPFYKVAFLHSFTHIDRSAKFNEIFAYSVGDKNTLCPNAMLNVVDERGESTLIRILRVENSYVFLPKLVENNSKRVEAILVNMGKVPITLVRRDYSNPPGAKRWNSNYSSDSVAVNVAGLMHNYALHTVEYGCDDQGLFINATGLKRSEQERSINTMKNCCYNAHGKANVSRFKHDNTKRNDVCAVRKLTK